MIVILGKTASGKDAICRKLIQRGFHRVVTYTSRPMRPGEVQNQTYHFVSKEKFEVLIRNGLFAEYRGYLTTSGLWYYGSALEDYNRNLTDLIVLNPTGYSKVKKIANETVISFYIDSDVEIIKKRLLKRGDDHDEAMRRIESDLKDFKGIENEVDYVIKNNGDKTLDEIADEIEEIVNDVKEKNL